MKSSDVPRGLMLKAKEYVLKQRADGKSYKSICSETKQSLGFIKMCEFFETPKQYQLSSRHNTECALELINFYGGING